MNKHRAALVATALTAALTSAGGMGAEVVPRELENMSFDPYDTPSPRRSGGGGYQRPSGLAPKLSKTIHAERKRKKQAAKSKKRNRQK